MPSAHPRRAFTLIELTAAICLAATAGAAAVVALTPPPRSPSAPRPAPPRDAEHPDADRAEPRNVFKAIRDARTESRRRKDEWQVRSHTQAMAVFAMHNKDRFPLPSTLDRQNRTIALPGRAKDTTDHIFSILIFQGAVALEMCIAPGESNPNIRVNQTYQYADPEKAVDPEWAMWDPAFSVDFTGGAVGNLSYAHLQPAGGRLEKWAWRPDADQPVISSRGPEITHAITDTRGNVTGAKLARDDSFTLRNAYPRDAWRGHVSYADGSVRPETLLGPVNSVLHDPRRRYTNRTGGKTLDLHFLDEADDPASTNSFLGIFTKAGEKPADYAPIWD